MVKSIKQAKSIQERRANAGKKGLAAAVRRFLKREKLGFTALK